MTKIVNNSPRSRGRLSAWAGWLLAAIGVLLLVACNADLPEVVGSSGEIAARCGVISQEEAAGIVQVLTDADFGEVGMRKVTSASLDWADGNGTGDVFLIPRMPDGFPECEDQF